MDIAEILERVASASNPDLSLSQLLADGLTQETAFSLSPWGVWTLFSLVRHHQRQEFVAEVVRTRLNGDLQQIADKGAFGHPEGPQRGPVPGLVEWEYYFHGRGCCLTYRATGESIDVDFWDDTADWFDPWFYVHYLESLRSPAPCEGRVISLHPSHETVLLAWDELREVGLLVPRESLLIRLNSDIVPLFDSLEMIDARFHTEATSRLAAAFGDWTIFRENEIPEAFRNLWKVRIAALKAKRSRGLCDLFDRDHRPSLALQALVEADAPEADDCLRRALAGPLSGTTCTALEIIRDGGGGDSEWNEPIHAVLRRVDPSAKAPQPAIWLLAVEYLLRNDDQHAEIARHLGHAVWDSAEAALLAMEFAPEQAIILFRRALRSDVPNDRIVAAAVLALIDRPWSHRELTQVLEESTEQEPTAECRASLRETSSPEAHRAVDDWEALNPYEPEQAEFRTVAEWFLLGMGTTIRFEMSEYHDRVLPLRHIVPPSPGDRG